LKVPKIALEKGVRERDALLGEAEAKLQLSEFPRVYAGSEASLALQARGSILAISEALIEHASYFDAGAPV
jgi:hypothetical protein